MAEPNGKDLPFHVQYIRLQKKCKKCDDPIRKNELTLSAGALCIKSGGVINHPYHFSCFFGRKGRDQLPQDVYQIANFECIRWSDQQKIREKLDEIAAGPSSGADQNDVPHSAIKRKRLGNDSSDKFSIGYSSGYGTPCRLCQMVIAQGDLRILKGDGLPRMDSERAHLECFAKVRLIERFLGAGYELRGFQRLSIPDQRRVIAAIPGTTLVDVTNTSTINPSEVIKKEKEFLDTLVIKKRLQNERFYNFRDHLKDLSQSYLVRLLAENGQRAPPAAVDILDILSDQMAFGTLLPCSACVMGQLIFHSWIGYRCTSQLSEWATCSVVYTDPIRLPFKVSDCLKQRFPFLNECGRTETRLFEKRVRPWHAVIHKSWPIAEDSDKLSPQQSLITVDNDLLVDPAAQNAKHAHVYRSDIDGTAYSASLTCTDVLAGINSFFTIQVLESDKYPPVSGKMRQYWLFKSGGIIGGDCWRTERIMTLGKAVKAFEKEFEKHTGNLWAKRNDFKKLDDKKFFAPDYKHKPSRLTKPVRELIELLVDERAMHEKARTKKLDLERIYMPLMRLSPKRILDAEAVLDAIFDAMTDVPNRADWRAQVTHTNHFYSLIPHNFGSGKIPNLLDNLDRIEKMYDLLETLRGMVFMYPLEMRDLYPIDSFYQRLNVSLRPVSGAEPALKYIERCAKEIYDTSVRYKIIQVFEVDRLGERERFNPRRLHNRKLLWHGSSLTNHIRILSKGLLAAPRNVHRTGDQFGRGIYFADYIEKAGHFCRVEMADTDVGRLDAVGLLLLCEVALGNVKNLLSIDPTIERPPRGYDSVRGVGRVTPLRSYDNVFNDEELLVDEPGTCTAYANDVLLPSIRLYHTEYIVYNPAQIKIRYLVEFLKYGM